MRYILFFLMTAFVSNTGLADVPNLTEEQRVFIEDYIEAAEEKDGELYWDLIHPESRRCMSESFKKFTIQNFMKKVDQLSQLDSENIRIEEIDMANLEKQVTFFYRDKAFLSVQPNYTLTSEVTTEEPDSGVCALKSSVYMFSVPVAFYNDAWYEVMPCGKNDLDVFLDKQLAARAHQKKRIENLYESVPQDVWDELHPVLTEERQVIKATKSLKESQGLSLSEARAVIGIRCEKLVTDQD